MGIWFSQKKRWSQISFSFRRAEGTISRRLGSPHCCRHRQYVLNHHDHLLNRCQTPCGFRCPHSHHLQVTHTRKTTHTRPDVAICCMQNMLIHCCEPLSVSPQCAETTDSRMSVCHGLPHTIRNINRSLIFYCYWFTACFAFQFSKFIRNTHRWCTHGRKTYTLALPSTSLRKITSSVPLSVCHWWQHYTTQRYFNNENTFILHRHLSVGCATGKAATS